VAAPNTTIKKASCCTEKTIIICTSVKHNSTFSLPVSLRILSHNSEIPPKLEMDESLFNLI
jgi:hypothetical protein